MKTRVAMLFYFVWAALAAGIIYLVTDAGHSFWLAATLAYVLFIFVNGSLAYVFRARQLRREGKQPPSYLMYLFFPKGVRHNVAVPRPLRVLLGILISLGGALFVIVGGLMLTAMDFWRMPHSIGAVAMLLVLLVLGAAFAYVGFRLIIVKKDEPLLRRRQTKSSQIDAA
jgi:hypothetical protein